MATKDTKDTKATKATRATRATKLECEGDAPENWKDDVILERNAKGAVVEITVPDDEEVKDNAAND